MKTKRTDKELYESTLGIPFNSQRTKQGLSSSSSILGSSESKNSKVSPDKISDTTQQIKEPMDVFYSKGFKDGRKQALEEVIKLIDSLQSSRNLEEWYKEEPAEWIVRQELKAQIKKEMEKK